MDETQTAERMTVAALADLVGAEVIGDGGERRILRVAPLRRAGPDAVSFFTNARYRPDLQGTRAGAVLIRPEHAGDCPTVALVVPDPYAAFARVAERLHPRPRPDAGIHPTAVIAPDARMGKQISVGAHAVVESGARLGDEVVIGAGSYVGRRTVIGDGSWLANHVSVGDDCLIGVRAILHPGVVIGADGFGFAADADGWRKVPQLGRVRLGADVEIGANATIDRGALDDTIVEDGVKLDNMVHVAHNVRVGAGTAIAGGTVIAGSTSIGRNCQIGGASAITGHIDIADGVTILGMSGVSGTIREPGVYGSPLPAQPVRQWRRNTVRVTQLDNLFQRVRMLENSLQALQQEATCEQQERRQ